MAAKICNICNKRRVYTGTGPGVDPAPHASDMCNYCFTEGSWENTHSDGDHNAILALLAAGDAATENPDEDEMKFMEGCWICHPELNLAQKPVKASTGAKAQGARRPQLNHKGHNHPQTPAARRECKRLFWATKPAEAKLAEAMQAWDCQLDAFGKQITTKAASWNVAPLGPKGGVGASIKAAAAKVNASK